MIMMMMTMGDDDDDDDYDIKFVKFSISYSRAQVLPGGGGRESTIRMLYRYVLPDRVWFLRCSFLRYPFRYCDLWLGFL